MEIINARINNSSPNEVVCQPHLCPLRWVTRRQVTGKLYGPSSLDMASESYSKASFYKGLYHSFGHNSTWNNPSGNPYQYGAVFNFDFSPDGSTLAAASERRSILLFDPLTHKMHKAKTNAHTDCVNIVRYIDSRLFATCSDDGTVKLWDQRNVDKEIQTLKGHSHWVKNIESVNGKLLTSGFDGNIILWDYDRYTESGEAPHQVLFTTRNLMRTALSTDKSKLVMSTSSGYVMVVHDLDFNTLARDLDGFKPNIYRLMQMNPSAGNGTIPFSHLFQENRPHNRLEMISDFVDDVDVEIVASLKLHPSGNFMISRNTSSDEQHEHTCIHDLRNLPSRNSPRQDIEESSQSSQPSTSAASFAPQYLLSMAVDNSQAGPIDLSIHSRRTNRPQYESHDRSRERSRSPLRDERASTSRNGFKPTNIDPAQSQMLSRVLPSAQQRLDNLAANYASSNDQFMIFVQGGRDGVHQTLVLFADDKRNPNKKSNSTKNGKLLWYIEEPNMGRGFIKEPCFSYDGRIVCSPFAHGVRLLAVDSDCSELEDKLQEGKPKKAEMQEISSVYSHQNLVVAANFSPTHHLLVTGCLDGQVCFHQPLL